MDRTSPQFEDRSRSSNQRQSVLGNDHMEGFNTPVLIISARVLTYFGVIKST